MTVKNTLYTIASTGVLIACAVWSPFTKTIGYYSVGQYYVFTACLIMAACLLLLHIIKGRQSGLRFNGYDYLAAALFTGGLLWAVFYPGYYHNEGWLTYMFAGCCWLIFTLSIEYTGCRTWLLSFSLLFLFELGTGLLQLIKGYISNEDIANTVTGTLQHSGMYSCMLTVLLIPLYLTIRRSWYLFFPVLVILILCITRSRVGCTTLLFTHLVFYRHPIGAWITKYITRHQRVVWIAATLPVLFFLFYVKRMSTEGRLLVWKTTIGHIDIKHLITGHGLGSFSALYPLWQAGYFAGHPGMTAGFLSADWTFSAFNMYLEIFIETGLAGLTLFLILLYGYWKQVLKTAAGNQLFLYILLPAIILLQALVYYTFYLSLNLLLLAFVFATRPWPVPKAVPLPGAVKKRLSTVGIKWLAGIMLMALVFSCINSLRNVRDIYQWQQLSKDTKLTTRQQLAGMAKRWPVLKYNGKYLYDYGRLYLVNGRYAGAVDMFEQCKAIYCNQDLYPMLANACYLDKNYERAEYYQVLLTHMVPARLMYRYNLFLMYLQQKKNDKAKQTGNELLTTPVKIQGSMVNDILNHVKEEMKKI